MKYSDEQIGIPEVVYNDTKANIEALTGVAEGAVAYATDTDELGTYSGATWTWGSGGGGIAESAAADYGGTSTIVGWAAGYAKTITYWTIGDTVFVWFYINGTSNSATTTFTLPYASHGTYGQSECLIRVANNGAIPAGPGYASLPAGSSTVTCYATTAAGAFAAANAKFVVGNLTYKKA